MRYFVSFSANSFPENSDSSKPTVNVTVEDSTVAISHFAHDALRVRRSSVYLNLGNILVNMD